VALRDLLGYSVDENEMILAKFVHSFADASGDGIITKKDFEFFCRDMDEETTSLYSKEEYRFMPTASDRMVIESAIAEAILEEANAAR
jgi:hypothetical protein